MVYQNRFYRSWTESDLVAFEVVERETDIWFLADRDLSKEAAAAVNKYRKFIEQFIKMRPDFLTSLVPVELPAEEFEPAADIIKKMIVDSKKAGVGPMAGVAGALAEFAGKDLLRFSDNVVAENGGDIFISTLEDKKVGLFAGLSKFSGKLTISVKKTDMPLGIATSSGTVGHSLSFGKADAVTVMSPDATLADCFATAICNMVKTPDDVKPALDFAKSIDEISGCVVIYGGTMGSVGNVEFV